MDLPMGFQGSLWVPPWWEHRWWDLQWWELPREFPGSLSEIQWKEQLSGLWHHSRSRP